MRKLMHSKKGFTLVELMIVVVIMAILVAVAVPIYGAVTRNAEKRSCQANMRIIVENMNQYQMTGDDGEMIPFSTLAATFNSAFILNDSAPAGFKTLFNDGIPTCPSQDTAYYDVTVTAATADNPENKIEVACKNTDTNTANEHNNVES